MPEHDGDISALDEAAIAAFELFQSYRRAGFTEGQALRLLAIATTCNTDEGDPDGQ